MLGAPVSFTFLFGGGGKLSFFPSLDTKHTLTSLLPPLSSGRMAAGRTCDNCPKRGGGGGKSECVLCRGRERREVPPPKKKKKKKRNGLTQKRRKKEFSVKKKLGSICYRSSRSHYPFSSSSAANPIFFQETTADEAHLILRTKKRRIPSHCGNWSGVGSAVS